MNQPQPFFDNKRSHILLELAGDNNYSLCVRQMV